MVLFGRSLSVKMDSLRNICPCCMRLKMSPEELELKYRSKQIDKMIEKDKRMLRRQVKILLLGAGESGKSTFLKQMRIIHGLRFESELVKEFQQVIYQNMVRGMRVLADARQKLSIPWQNPGNQIYANQLLMVNNSLTFFLDTDLFLEFAPSLKKLWADGGIRRAYERRSEFQLSDSVQYFFDALDRISTKDFLPTTQDILHARKATKGITEMVITIETVPFRFVDVGGQRSQRQKWFQCFDSVTSIIFLVSSSEYDQVLLEDRKTNRVVESRNIFEAIVNHPAFARVSVIMLFNKTDLLQQKLTYRETKLSYFFPEFKGDPWSLQDIQAFLIQYFISVRRDPEKKIFHHFTTAVDTDNIRVVFEAVKDTILSRNLDQLMLQ